MGPRAFLHDFCRYDVSPTCLMVAVEPDDSHRKAVNRGDAYAGVVMLPTVCQFDFSQLPEHNRRGGKKSVGNVINGHPTKGMCRWRGWGKL
jgi:hypothetical protein